MRILDMFDEAEVRATFFALGWVAERHGGMMREIVNRGHELASHGWDHGRVFRMDRAVFSADIERARKVLEDTSGSRITGYRAPSFSIDMRTPWAFQELAAQGYAYSSSVAPISHDHYGWADAPRFAFRPLPWASLVELPVTTAMFAGKRLAAGGGGFFRVHPLCLLPMGDPPGEPTRWALRGLLFPPVGNRSRPAARGRCAAQVAAQALHQPRPDGRQVAPADR